MEHADHDCSSHSTTSSVHQTLDELDFDRGIWPAALSGDLEDVNRHINKNEDVNRRDKAGYTALHYACRNGHLSVVKALIDAGANVNAVTKSVGATPLHRAAYMGHTDIVRHLLSRGAKPLMTDADGMTPLHKAAERDRIHCVTALLEVCPDAVKIKDNRDRTPIKCAMEENLKCLFEKYM